MVYIVDNEDCDLFPETQGQILPEEWLSDSKDRYGFPLVVVRLLSKWEEIDGMWHVGWLVNAGTALDEWHPNNPDAYKAHSDYPWYRLETLPMGKTRNLALGIAGRAAKIVLAQMLPYIDTSLHAEVTRIQEQIEQQARMWLQ